MTEPQFDPKGFFKFDMARGSVHVRDNTRVLVLSENVLAPLIINAVRNGDLTAVRELGGQLGNIVADSLGKPAKDLSTTVVLSHAASVMALYGWGRLQLEQWGNALVLEVEELPPLDNDNLAVAALLGGMFSRLVSQEVACVPIGKTNRYLMVDPSIAERVWTWSRSGHDVGTIISKLSIPEAK